MIDKLVHGEEIVVDADMVNNTYLVIAIFAAIVLFTFIVNFIKNRKGVEGFKKVRGRVTKTKDAKPFATYYVDGKKYVSYDKGLFLKRYFNGSRALLFYNKLNPYNACVVPNRTPILWFLIFFLVLVGCAAAMYFTNNNPIIVMIATLIPCLALFVAPWAVLIFVFIRNTFFAPRLITADEKRNFIKSIINERNKNNNLQLSFDPVCEWKLEYIKQKTNMFSFDGSEYLNYCEDHFYGKYNDIHFQYADIMINADSKAINALNTISKICMVLGSRVIPMIPDKTIFIGGLFFVDKAQPIKNEIRITPQAAPLEDKKSIPTGNVEFDDMFNVYSDDASEVNKYLTEERINKLLDLKCGLHSLCLINISPECISLGVLNYDLFDVVVNNANIQITEEQRNALYNADFNEMLCDVEKMINL